MLGTLRQIVWMLLVRSNTHLVANVGLFAGGLTLVGALYGLFGLLDDPTYLVALYGATIRAHEHAATQTDVFTIARLVAASFAVFGGFVMAIVASRYGMPETIQPDKPPKSS